MTATLTLKSVSIQPGCRTITVSLQYLDGQTVLIDQDISGSYCPDGETQDTAMAKIQSAAQALIDTNKAEQAAKLDASLLLAIDAIEAALEV